MKDLLIIFLVMLSLPQLSAQQVSLKGQVSIHNSKYRTGKIQYVKDAYVSAFLATPRNTDNTGGFDLIFAEVDPGTSVEVKVEKANLEVVNSYDLQQVIIGRKPILRVFLAPKGQLVEAQTALYQISRQALFAEKNALIKRLEASKEEQVAVIAELEERFGKKINNRFEARELIDQKLDELKRQLPKFAQQLAKKNLDFASSTYIKAFEYYEAGKILEALKVLNDEELEASYQKAKSTILEGKNLRNIGKYLESQGLLQVEQVVNSYQLKADAYRLLFQFRDAKKVSKKNIQILEESYPKSRELGDAYFGISRICEDLGEYKEMLEWREKNVKLKEQLISNPDTSLADAYHSLANAYRLQGMFEEAMKTQLKAHSIWTEELSPDDPKIAHSFNHLSLIHQDLGNLAKALETRMKSHDIWVEILPALHPELAISYNNLAVTYVALGRFAEAQDAQLKDLEISKKTLKPNDPKLAQAYNNLSLILVEAGDYVAALDTIQKALQIYNEVLEPEHPKIANTYRSMGSIYWNLGRSETGLEAEQRAVKIFEKIFDGNHPNIATGYNNLSLYYQDLKDFNKALEAQLKAIEIRQKKHGEKHPIVATSYSNLGIIYKDLKDYSKSLKAHRKAIGIRKEILESDHPSMGTAYHNVVSVYFAKNDLDSALYYEYLAHEIFQKHYGLSHPRMKTVIAYLVNLHNKRGQALRSVGKNLEAIQDFEKALAHNPEKALLFNQLGMCYDNLKDYKKALELYQKSYELNGVREFVFLNNAGLSNTKSGNLEQAEQQFKKLQELLPNNGIVHRNWCLFYCFKKEKDNALDSLEKAVQMGYKDVKWLEKEEGLNYIRKHKRYKAVIEQLKVEP